MKRKTVVVLAAAFSVPLAVLIAQAPQGQQPGGRGRGGQRGGGFVLGAEMAPGEAAANLAKVKLPRGFSVSIYADNVPGARSMALAPDGTLFMGTRGQVVHAVVDRNKDFKADEVLTVGGLTLPNGVALWDGALYVAEISRISRFDGVLDFVKAPGGGPTPKQTVLTDKLPTDRQHGWKYLAG